MARVRGGNTGFAVALVIFGCGFVIALLVAIIFYTKIEEHKVAEDNAKNQLAEFISGVETAQANQHKSNDATVFGNLKNDIAELEIQLREANDKVVRLEGEKRQMEDTYETLAGEKKLVDDQLLAERKTSEQNMQDRKEAIEQALSENVALNDQKNAIQEQLNVALKDADEAAQTRITDLTEQVKAEQDKKDAAVLEAARWKREYDLLLPRLPKPPPIGTTTPDAEVASVFGQDSNDLFITLGRKNGLVLGMNFEVYDPLPVIKLTDVGEARGKATIEIYALKDDSATCRVVRRERGATINPGDPIVNIAYHPDMTIKMFAFGEFDIERDGGTNDIGRIEALIKESGAELVELTKNDAGIPILTPDINYIVLGDKPELPEEPGRDVFDPVIIAEYQAALAANEAYFQIVDEAKILRIPVLSQERFLELVGYYVR